MSPAKVESANFEQTLHVEDGSVSFDGYPGFSVEVLENSGGESEIVKVKNYGFVGVSSGDDSSVSIRYDFIEVFKKITWIAAGYADFAWESSDNVRVSLVDKDLKPVKLSDIETARR